MTSYRDTTDSVPSYETIDPFVFYHSEGRYNFDSAVTDEIKKFMVKYTVASQEGLQTDKLTLADLPDLKVDIEFSAEFYANDTSIAYFEKSISVFEMFFS